MHCVFCTNCCFNMDLVFDRGMMMMGRMFRNIYACLVVSFFSLILAYLMSFGVCFGCVIARVGADLLVVI